VNLAAYKRGRGGRSSFSGTVATIFGASGFLGRYIVAKLGRTGSQVIVPYRCDPYEVQRLKLSGDLGQVLFLPFDLKNEDSIRKAMKYSNVVINLVGRDWETKNYTFDDVHVEGSRRIARIAKEMEVPRLIHFSALNATPEPQQIYQEGGSQYLKSKYFGELAVREEYPDATVIRPADIFGAEDRFTRYYVNTWRRAHGTLPLWKKGTETIKQPVFCSDVAEAVVNAIKDPDAVGKVFDAVGPHRYYLSDLIDFFYRIIRYPRFKRINITPVFRAKAYYLSHAPNEPICTPDKLEREHITDRIPDGLTLEDLGVKLTPIEQRAIFDLKPFRFNAYYHEALGEFKDPEHPPVIL